MIREIDTQRVLTCERDVRRVVYKCLERGNRFVVLYGVRTKAEQAELYAQGRTKPGKIVTWTLNSRHLPNRNGLSEAIDLAPIGPDGKIDWNDYDAFNKLGAEMKAAARECGVEIEWGGDWKRKDRPHFQLAYPR